MVDDSVFQENLETSFNHWCLLRSRFQYPLLDWWEVTIKPGIRKLALERSKEINKFKRGNLNLLYLRQNFLLSSVKKGKLKDLSELTKVQSLIKKWFEDEASRILTQIDMDDISGVEAVRIHHHEIHKKKITQSYILQ